MTAWLLPLAATLLPAADPTARYDIPYRLTDTKHVMVRVKLNGHGPFNFILDTGAPAVFIPKKIAKQIGVKLDRGGWGTLDSFEVEGGLKVPATKTRVEDLFQLEGMNGMGLAGVELHGVVGYNVLAQYRITYDFTAGKLVWVPLKDFTPPAPKGLSTGGGQGGLEILGPVMKMLAAFMGVTPNFERKPRGHLGVELADAKAGLVVSAVLPGSPAEEGGLKAKDVITRANGKDVETTAELVKAVGPAVVGDTVKLVVKRGDETLTLPITLGKGL